MKSTANRGRRKSKKGSGLTLPGGGARSKKMMAKKMSSFMLKKVLPVIIKKIQSGTGLKLAGQGMANNKKLNTLMYMKVLKHLNDGASRDGKTIEGAGMMPTGAQMKAIAKDIAKTLLPMLVNKVASVANKKISGMGMCGSGMYGKGMCGSGLTGKLTTGLLKSMLGFFKNQGGKGAQQVGEGFFDDFAKGFKKGFLGVINPAIGIAKKLAPLAPLLL